MRTPRSSPQRGTVTIILLGLLSVMIFLAFTLSQRQRGHGNLIAFGDAHLYARYFLEAHMGDVITQLKQEANDLTKKGKGGTLYDFLRSEAAGSFPGFYQASELVKGIPGRWADLGIEVAPNWSPTLQFSEIKPLEYPPSLVPPDTYLKKLEKRGTISITCSATVQGRKYTLSAEVPFSVVMRLSPILREFVLFADQISLEQTRPFGREDQLNLTFTKAGIHPKEPDSGFEAFKGQPWVLWPAKNHENDRHRNGRVFLGEDGKPIYLNLAGEREYRSGPVSELWQIPPMMFKVNKDMAGFSNNAIFMDQNMKYINFRGLDIQLANKGFWAKMGVLGFSSELYDKNNGFFAATTRTPDKIWGDDPSFQKLYEAAADPSKPQGYGLALSSSLKLYGLNNEPTMDQDPATKDKPYIGFAREVFGEVYSRFLILTFFEFPSAQGGGQILTYDSNPNHRPPPCPKYQGYDTVTFEPPDPSQKYTWFMSRVVSGGADRDVLKDDYMPYNMINPDKPDDAGNKVVLDFGKFTPIDGCRLKGSFVTFAKEWMKFDPAMRLGTSQGTLQSRVSMIYPNQEAFKNAALLKEKKFWIDGVVYVLGDLTLDDITTKDIHGGIVIVEKDIILGNITRGVDFSGSIPIDKVMDEMEKIDQSQFLTFVSRTGSIRLKGDKQLGVQLVVLTQSGSVRDQISWLDPKKIVFGGGIAVDTPNMVNRVKEFGKSGQDPIFLYAPKMADPDPSTVVQVYPTLDAYRFTLE